MTKKKAKARTKRKAPVREVPPAKLCLCVNRDGTLCGTVALPTESFCVECMPLDRVMFRPGRDCLTLRHHESCELSREIGAINRTVARGGIRDNVGRGLSLKTLDDEEELEDHGDAEPVAAETSYRPGMYGRMHMEPTQLYPRRSSRHDSPPSMFAAQSKASQSVNAAAKSQGQRPETGGTFEQRHRGGEMTIGQAVEALKTGSRVARAGWNGKGMYLSYQPGYPDGIAINANTAKATGHPEGTVLKFLPYVMMRTAGGEFVPWLCSQTDLLAEDWSIVL